MSQTLTQKTKQKLSLTLAEISPVWDKILKTSRSLVELADYVVRPRANELMPIGTTLCKFDCCVVGEAHRNNGNNNIRFGLHEDNYGCKKCNLYSVDIFHEAENNDRRALNSHLDDFVQHWNEVHY